MLLANDIVIQLPIDLALGLLSSAPSHLTMEGKTNSAGFSCALTVVQGNEPEDAGLVSVADLEPCQDPIEELCDNFGIGLDKAQRGPPLPKPWIWPAKPFCVKLACMCPTKAKRLVIQTHPLCI